MSLTYIYGIYDVRNKEWMPGTYKANEVRNKLGITGSISDMAKMGTLIQKRYRVVIVEEIQSPKDTFAEEWDAARMKLLR